MTFFADFLQELTADVGRALQLQPTAIYLGREPQKVQRQGFEVWVKPEAVETQAATRLHTLDLHVRLRARREGNLSGGVQLGSVLDAIARLRDRYDGLRPFSQTVPALVALEAEAGPLDTDPEDADVLDGALRLKALERIA